MAASVDSISYEIRIQAFMNGGFHVAIEEKVKGLFQSAGYIASAGFTPNAQVGSTGGVGAAISALEIVKTTAPILWRGLYKIHSISMERNEAWRKSNLPQVTVYVTHEASAGEPVKVVAIFPELLESLREEFPMINVNIVHNVTFSGDFVFSFNASSLTLTPQHVTRSMKIINKQRKTNGRAFIYWQYKRAFLSGWKSRLQWSDHLSWKEEMDGTAPWQLGQLSGDLKSQRFPRRGNRATPGFASILRGQIKRDNAWITPQ